MLDLPELLSAAVFLLVFGALMASCALLSGLTNRAGLPLVLIFLLLGMLGGSEGIGGLAFDNATLAFQIGTIALVLILFDGGMNTSWASVRVAALPAGLLATVGVLLTGLMLAVVARALGLAWGTALLIGAIVSSTDAAAVFAVLRGGGLHLQPRVRSVLEIESCVNDPMAVVLTLVVAESLRFGAMPGPQLFLTIPLQLAIGAVAGLCVALGVRLLLRYVRLSSAGLYPVVTLGAAFASFGAGTLVGGSGFLAVFVAGVSLGNGPLPYKAGLRRVHDSLAWLSQVAMFLVLGLLVFPSRLLAVLTVGLALGLVLALVARPIAVAICLVPLRWRWTEIVYVGLVGLRGAVPIVLATIPVMSGLPNAEKVFHVVFFIVVLSSVFPGGAIVPLTKRLGLGEVRRAYPAASLELHTLRRLGDELRLFVIEPTVAAAGARLADIEFPEGAAVVLIVREDRPITAQGDTTLLAGDHVYVMCRSDDEPVVGLLLGPSVAS